KSFSLQLPETTDFRVHSAEIIFPELSSGQYIFLFSADPSFNYSENAVAFDFKTVSNISFINRPNREGDQEFTLFHRQTGKPLSNAVVKAFFVKYDYRQRKATVENIETLKTNNDGYVKIKSRENNSTLIVEFKDG